MSKYHVRKKPGLFGGYAIFEKIVASRTSIQGIPLNDHDACDYYFQSAWFFRRKRALAELDYLQGKTIVK